MDSPSYQGESPALRVIGPLAAPAGSHRGSGGRAGRLLTWLALDANHWVRIETLVRRMWAEGAPAQPRHELKRLVHQAEGALGGCATILEHDRSLRLEIDPAELDVTLFERLITTAPADAVERRRALTLALSLWRGSPYPAVADHPDAFGPIVALEQLHLDGREELAALRLATDDRVDHATLAELRSLVDISPGRSRAWKLLITGLDRAGRRVEALRTLDELRARHVGGNDPELERLEDAILRPSP